MRHLLLGAAAITVMFTFPAIAQDTIIALPDGHTALNLSATEKIEAEQDLLVASLRIQIEDKESKVIQKKINTAMKKAIEIARKSPEIKVETGHYYVHPDYRYINKPDGSNEQLLSKWRGSQTLTLESKNAEELLKVVGEIQDMDFLMNSLNYRLSDDKYAQIRDGLMEVTIESLIKRAERVAKALGKANVDLVEINVDAHSPRPYPVYARRQVKAEMMMMASEDAGMPAPVAEAGETTVSMTINARAIIKP